MLRVATLNLNYRNPKHGAWKARRALIVETLQRAQADVVALQAVEDADASDQATEIAALLQYEEVVYVAATEGADTKGSAFIARRALTDVSPRRLSLKPNLEDTQRRVIVRARIATAAGAIDVYNAHFSWVPAQASDNVREALDFREPGPMLLLGDLNNIPDSAAVQVLQRAGLIDLWGALRPDEPGYTFEADHPTLRIDYALASPDVRARAQAIELLGSSAGPPRLADHLGLMVTLRDTALPS